MHVVSLCDKLHLMCYVRQQRQQAELKGCQIPEGI